VPKVIEWVEEGEGDIVWKYPVEEIGWGDILIVKEHQAAVFFRDGKAYDVFRAGRHTITTANLPLLTRILSKIMGFGKIPFRATVVFVSLKQFQGKFGAKGQTKELAPISFYGSFWFRVREPNLFVNEVVGGQGLYTTEKLRAFLRGYFNERLIDTLSQYPLREIYGKLDETSALAKHVLYDAFRRIGLELIDVKFEGIDTEPEWRDRLFYLNTGVSAKEILKMETVSKAAKSIAQAPGAGVGVGMVLIPQLFSGSTATAQQAGPLCPKCGFQNPPGAQFCARCGSPLTTSPVGIKCPKCGFVNPPGAKFCAQCGAQLSSTYTTCPNCGARVSPGAKFCPNCGAQLT